MFEDDRTRAQDQATAEAFADPRPGDRFQEMYSWWMIVISAGPEGVKVMSGSGPTNLVRGRFPDGQIVEPFPKRAEVRWYATAEEFRDAWRYGGATPGYSMMLSDRGKVDVTGWLGRAKSVPDEPTHPARAAEKPAATPDPERYSFTRDSLTDALARLEVRVMLTGPIANMINAESMADAIIEALGQRNPVAEPREDGRRD